MNQIRKAERLQQNIEVEDLKDKLAGSNPFNITHVYETIAYGHESIELALSDEQKAKYLNGNYRLRIIKYVVLVCKYSHPAYQQQPAAHGVLWSTNCNIIHSHSSITGASIRCMTSYLTIKFCLLGIWSPTS